MVLECDALTNYLIFVNALHNTTQLPVTLWQIPVGRINSTTAISPYTNAKFPDLTNTTQNYEDSASTYFFGDTFTTTGTRAHILRHDRWRPVAGQHEREAISPGGRTSSSPAMRGDGRALRPRRG